MLVVVLCVCKCVKALVYINQDNLLNVNGQNDFGDTALHLAAKWGYGKKRTICVRHSLHLSPHI